jgi:hypothetical protein
MSLIEINWHPNRKELRNFGIIALIATAVISLVLHLLKDLGSPWILIILGVGFVIFLSSIISTKITRIIYIGLILVTFPIGWVMSFILMAIFYFLIITPLGIFFRMIGRDTLCRKFDRNAGSYWQTHRKPENLDSYFHQF